MRLNPQTRSVNECNERMTRTLDNNHATYLGYFVEDLALGSKSNSKHLFTKMKVETFRCSVCDSLQGVHY